MKSERTFLPWKWHEEEAYIETAMPNLRGEYEHICDFRTDSSGKYNMADAKFIELACNSHERLLNAAKLALDYLDPKHNNGHTRAWTEGMIRALRIAILEAEGEQ